MLSKNTRNEFIKPKVAVLVLNYNGKIHLKECFESLKEQTYENYEVYLVDNASSDDSIEYTKRLFPWVKIIAFNRNWGFAEGYNRAIKLMKTNLIALLNNDTKVDKKWLEELVKAIVKDNKIIAVGSKILLYEDPRIINHAGAKITPIGGGFDIGFLRCDKGKGESYRSKYVGAVCGAAMLVRRDLFLKIGGFDKHFFAYFEDTDFCWRAWLLGYKVLFVPSSIVYHKLGGSWGRKSPIKVYLGQKNRIISLIKNFNLLLLLRGLFLNIVYTSLKLLEFMLSRDTLSTISLLKAYFYVIRNIRDIIKKRIIIQSKRRINDTFLIKYGLIASLDECIKVYYTTHSIRRIFS